MNDMIPIVEGGIVRPGSLDEIQRQIELLAGFGLPPSSAERYEVVLRGETKVLRKRDRPMKFMLDVPKHGVVPTDISLPSEKFFHRSSPSRYGDENRATAVSTIELKEAFYAG